MQFQVPQFIEVEDKLVGPLTFRQFIYVLGGGGGSYLVWQLLSPISSILAMVFILPIAGIALALAFYKVNNRPFIVFLEYGIKHFLSTRLYLWRPLPPKAPAQEKTAAPVQKAPELPTLTESRLKDLAWSLDIAEKRHK